MGFDWSSLRDPAPETLGSARMLAHRAVQWPARAARANLDAVADDGHTSLAWDPGAGALCGRPLPGGVRVGVRVASLELLFVGAAPEALPLADRTDGEIDAWLDAKLARAGLKPASAAPLPHPVPRARLARAGKEAAQLAALAGWHAAAAELLEEKRLEYLRFRPGPSPVRCWPHHFDIAILVALEEGHAESARSIGIGVSPGDEYYAEPYAYVSPYPRPGTSGLPALPPGGRWHTRDFFGAVATARDLLKLPDPRAGLAAVIDAAFETGLRTLRI